jgi:hypothetical protein
VKQVSKDELYIWLPYESEYSEAIPEELFNELEEALHKLNLVQDKIYALLD